jgi:hypothetical protein
MEDQQKTAPLQGVEQVRRSEDFNSYYANNVQFELSAFDLKFILGSLDQRGGKIAVEQFAEVSITWVEAKLLSFYLQVNIAAHEAEDGKIVIPKRLIPPDASIFQLSKELAENPVAKEARERYAKIRESFLAENQSS